MVNYVTSGNYVEYKIISTYNVFNKIIKAEEIIESIDLNCPILTTQEVYVVGAYIPLTKETDFNEETCLFINFTTKDDYFLLNGNLESYSYHAGLVDTTSSLSYIKITCEFYLDKYKLHFNGGNFMGESIKRPLIYIYSNGQTSLRPINKLTSNKESREFNIDPWTILSENTSDLSKYFIQDVIYDSDYSISDNIFIDIKIIDKDTPDYYELLEFNANGDLIGKQYLYSPDEISNLSFNSSSEKILLCEIKNNNIISSQYVTSGKYIKVAFSNKLGMFNKYYIPFNI